MYITKSFSYFAAGKDKDAQIDPHFNTLSTMVRILEKEGFLDHKQFGNTYQYYPVVTEAEYGRSSIAGVIKNYFNIDQIENQND